MLFYCIFRKANSVLGASRIQTSLGGVRREFMLDTKHLLPTPKRGCTRGRHWGTASEIRGLLSVDSNRISWSSDAFLGTISSLASRVQTSPNTPQICKRSGYPRQGTSTESCLLFSRNPRGNLRVHSTTETREIFPQTHFLLHTTQCGNYPPLFLRPYPLYWQLRGPNLSDETLHWKQ